MPKRPSFFASSRLDIIEAYPPPPPLFILVCPPLTPLSSSGNSPPLSSPSLFPPPISSLLPLFPPPLSPPPPPPSLLPSPPPHRSWVWTCHGICSVYRKSLCQRRRSWWALQRAPSLVTQRYEDPTISNLNQIDRVEYKLCFHREL